MASFIEYLNSEEYQDFLNKQKESLDLYTRQAKDYFETLDYDVIEEFWDMYNRN